MMGISGKVKPVFTLIGHVKNRNFRTDSTGTWYLFFPNPQGNNEVTIFLCSIKMLLGNIKDIRIHKAIECSWIYF